MSTEPVKVAVIGGGCGAITAAFELSRPEHEGRYEVTVYQVGWRLGGKGASGRGPAMRIEEHGLHMWLGCYENAFRLMRQCYKELDRDPEKCRLANWRDAFEPYPFLGISELAEGIPDSVWRLLVSVDDLEPGDPDLPPEMLSLSDYMLRIVNLLYALMRDLTPEGDESGVSVEALSGSDLMAFIDRVTRYGETITLTLLKHLISFMEEAISDSGRYEPEAIVNVLTILERNLLEQLKKSASRNRAYGRVWSLFDLTFATMRGIISDNLLSDPRGLDAINDYDCREWLLLHGCAPESVDSGYMRAMYDMIFAYESGDSSRPRMEAGQAVRSIMRALFNFRGTFFWRMNAGMGDVVFAPFYEVMKARGVKFEFFHRLENLELGEPEGGERPYISALSFDVQANMANGEAYDPLIEVDGLPCWPSAPRFEQLVDGDVARRGGLDFESFWNRAHVGQKRLDVGVDFDAVVLGVGLGAVPHLCRELVEADPKWRAMIQNVQTVATQSFQLWMTEDMSELGWDGDDGYAVSGFLEPFDTWADMRHLLPEERWEPEPKALGYFCNAMPDSELDDLDLKASGGDVRAAQNDIVRHNAIRFLNEDVHHLWPRARSEAGKFRWELVADPHGSCSDQDESRFDTQFWVANANPSDRYVQSLPGTARYRISPLDETYSNLTVAGDWTDCGLNSGCVEAAVISGRLAAHAISQSPPLDDIVGYDHP